jgi:hypothetical protein
MSLHVDLMCAETSGRKFVEGRFEDITASDILAFLTFNRIDFDIRRAETCTGLMLSQCDDEHTVMNTLGVRCLGDAVRVLKVNSLHV